MDTKIIPQNHKDSKELCYFWVNCDVIAKRNAYLWLSRRYFRSTIKMQIMLFSFCIALVYTYLCTIKT